MGQFEQAVFHFGEVLRLKPAEAAAHNKLGRLRATDGKYEEAIAHFRSAIEHQPDFAEAMNHLARIYATHPDAGLRNPREAVRLAERACELTERKNPACLGTLAAAYAGVRRFDESVATVKTAIELAKANGHQPLVAILQAHLAHYQQGRPYREVIRPTVR